MPDPAADLGPAPHLDPSRFDALIERIGPASMLVVLTSWMSAKLRGAMTPEDVFQETLVCAWRDRESHRWNSVAAYRAWILDIARHRIIDAARMLEAQKQGAGARAVPFTTLQGDRTASVSALLPPGSTTPSRTAIYAEQAKAMEAALADVPDPFAAVVKLYLFEERSMDAIAAELGIGLSAAWYRFRKGSELYAARLKAASG